MIARSRRQAYALALTTLALACCHDAKPELLPASPLTLRYRSLQRTERPETATSIYRGLLSRSLYSHCRLVPSDSEAFNLRAHACGALPAAFLSTARLLLEVEASAAILRPVLFGGRLRWMDPPGRNPCAL